MPVTSSTTGEDDESRATIFVTIKTRNMLNPATVSLRP
jgi:hypothetical protein